MVKIKEKVKVSEIVSKVKKALKTTKNKIDALLKKEGISLNSDYTWKTNNVLLPKNKNISEAISDALATANIEIEISNNFKEIKIILK